jgi:hypothetical protein
VLFFVGVVRADGPARFGTITLLLVLAAYLIYAHPAWWIVYYAEVFAVFFFVAVRELTRFGASALTLDAGQLRAALTLALLLASPWLIRDVVKARESVDRRLHFQRQAAKTLAAIPESSAAVFVRYPPTHQHHESLVLNTPDYRTAPLWLVYDRGADNERLLRTTDRAAYRLHTDTWVLEKIR